jgi:hypothetical protein
VIAVVVAVAADIAALAARVSIALFLPSYVLRSFLVV